MPAISLLCTGGTRSGKSALAQRWAESLAPERVYNATARAEDAETAARVHAHQQSRGQGWHTIEAPLELLPALHTGVGMASVLVVDCITMWISNCMAAEHSQEDILHHAREVGRWLRDAPCPVAVVTTELGLGMVPMTALGRAFRDVHGMVNQYFAAACSDVCLLVSGLPLMLKGNAIKENLCAPDL